MLRDSRNRLPSYLEKEIEGVTDPLLVNLLQATAIRCYEVRIMRGLVNVDHGSSVVQPQTLESKLEKS